MTAWGSQHPDEDHYDYGDGDERRVLPLIVFTVLLMLAVTAASFTLLERDGTVDEAEVVVLEPVGHVQEDDFFGDLDLATREDSEQSLTEITERASSLDRFTNGTTETAASLSGLKVVGTEPGLYAGNRRESVCAVQELTKALTESEEVETKASAWADVLGLSSTEEIPDYLGNLTPVRLRIDTRVTNYTFSDGQAVPFQSVLQAGTAVLVDDTGVPRVKCNCGNPLAEPAPLEDVSGSQALDVDQVATNPDLAWDRLDPGRVATVTSGSEPLSVLTIADIDAGDLMERPVGTNGSRDLGPGDFQATLRWKSSADLDLSVVDPNSATISAESPSPENSHGQLDEDANRQCEENMAGAEKVSWPDGDAPAGDYTVKVTGHAVGEAYQSDCGGNSAEFTLTIKMFGKDDTVHSESVTDGETKEYPVTYE